MAPNEAGKTKSPTIGSGIIALTKTMPETMIASPASERRPSR
jgi:hypothetical protein